MLMSLMCASFSKSTKERQKKKKKQKNSVVFFSISLECLNKELFGKEIARGLELGLFASARQADVYLSVH